MKSSLIDVPAEMEAATRILVALERKRQDDKWGPLPRGLSNGTWLAILTEEVGEVAKEIVEHRDGSRLVVELHHVAAVAQAWATEIMLKMGENVDEPTDGGGS